LEKYIKDSTQFIDS